MKKNTLTSFFALLVCFTLTAQSRYELPYQRLGVGSYTLFEIQNGKLFGAGANFAGVLGDGTQTNSNTLIQIGQDSNWVAIDGAPNTTFGIKSDGSLWGWGSNGIGLIGVAGPAFITSPVQLPGTNWKQVDAYTLHTCAIQADGSLWCWGNNALGQIGTGTISQNVAVPTRVGTDSDWVQVSVGGNYTVARKANGTIWGWGDNTQGVLTNPVLNAPAVTSPRQLGTDSTWTHIEAGPSNVVALKADGSLWAWGANGSGQVGNGTITFAESAIQQVGTDNDWVSVATGNLHCMAIKADGSLWGWGSNSLNPILPGNTTNYTSPVRIGTRNDWVDVDCGASWTCGLTADGFTHAWGFNAFGNYGNGTNTSVGSPVQLRQHICWLDVQTRSLHSIALRSDGKVYTCGSGSPSAGTGLPAVITAGGPVSTFNEVNLPEPAIAVAQGHQHGLAILADGRLAAWGNNAFGEVGNGTLTLVQTPVIVGLPGALWTSIAAGDRNSAGIQANGTLWTWGKNTSGILGQGLGSNIVSSNLAVNTPTRVGPDSIWNQLCLSTIVAQGIKADGSLWGWGSNNSGAIGLGAANTLYDVPQQVGNVRNWVQVRHNGNGGGLQADGSVWVWGSGFTGFAGNGTSTGIIPQPGRVLTITAPAIRISVGNAIHAVLGNGSMVGWGQNTAGLIGNGSRLSVQATPSAVVFGEKYPYPEGGVYGTIAINLQRDTICFTGSNISGIAGNPNIINTDIFDCTPSVLPQSQPGPPDQAAQKDSWQLISSQGVYTIKYNLEERSIKQFQLMSLDGKSLWVYTARSKGETPIPHRHLSPGVYVLKAQNDPPRKIIFHH